LALYILANSWEQLLLGVVIASFDSLRGTTIQALQAESVDAEHRAQAFAGFQTAANIPGIIVPVIAGSIIEAEGILVGEKIAITITIICALIANTIRAVFLQESLNSPDIAGKKESIIGHFRETAASVVKKRSIRVITISRAIAHFALDALNPLLVVYCIENIGVTETEYGIIIGISLVAMITSRLPAARFSDLHGWKTSMLIAAFLYPFFPIAYFLAPNLYWLVIAAIIEPIANSFNFPARNAYIADIVPAHKRAGTFSVMFAVIMLTAIPGTIFGALLWETYGPPTTFALCTGLFVISGLILAVYLEEEN
jgi:MFS family permease